MHRIQLKLLLALAVLLPMAFITMGKASQADAAPAGAAHTMYIIRQDCLPGGVQVRFQWTPSGLGQQWFDVSRVNDNFSSSFANAGPLAPAQNTLDWSGLQGNTFYVFRVNTLSAGGWLTSDTWYMTTIGCSGSGGGGGGGGAFTPPQALQIYPGVPGQVRFQWAPGAGNTWYCVDVAGDMGSLLSFSGSWRNYGCGTTSTAIDVTGLSCNTPYFWRVYAWGPGGSAHSAPGNFITAPCGFGAAYGLWTNNVTPTGVRFHWTPGVGNQWSCIDLATSHAELVNFYGSWRNYGCGTSGNALNVSGLRCNTDYYWRVWSVGAGFNAHSPVAHFKTGSCGSVQYVPAPIDDADIIVSSTTPASYTLRVVAGLPSGCASPWDIDVDRNGTDINVYVVNRMLTGQPCTAIYGTYTRDVSLGSNFQSGVTYTVKVNDEIVTFKAQ